MQTTIPKTLHFIWLGEKPIPPHCQKNIERWKELHPEWACKIWGNGMTLRCFHEDPPRGWEMASLVSRFDSLAAKSDILRLMILREFGGVYLDGDMEPVKAIDPMLNCGRGCFVGWEQNMERINNAVIGAAPNHPAICDALDNLPAHLYSGGGKVNLRDAAYATGPFYLTEIWKDDNRVTKFPREVFYPYDWHEPWKALYPPGPDTYAIHRWDASWIGETVPPEIQNCGSKCGLIQVGTTSIARAFLARPSILQQSLTLPAPCLEHLRMDDLEETRTLSRIYEAFRKERVERAIFTGVDHVLDRNFVATHAMLPSDVIGISPQRLYSSTKMFNLQDARKSDVFPFEVFKFHGWQSKDRVITNSHRDVEESFSVPLELMWAHGGELFRPSRMWRIKARQLIRAAEKNARCVWTYKTASTKLCQHPVNEESASAHVAQWDNQDPRKIILP